MKWLRIVWILFALGVLTPLSSGQCQITVDSAYVYKCAEWKVKSFVYKDQRDSLNVELQKVVADKPNKWQWGGFGYIGGLVTAILIFITLR